MEKTYHTNLTDTELNLCLTGKVVKYSCDKGVFKAVLVSVHGKILFFRDTNNPIGDVYPVENAKVFHNEHNWETINKIN